MKKAYKYIVSVILLASLAVSSLFMLTACKKEEKVTLEEDTVFYLDNEVNTVFGIPFYLFADDNSRITLTADGRAIITIETASGIDSLLSLLNVYDFIEGADLDEMLTYLPSVFFPGQTIAELEGLLEAADKGINLKINGFDFEDSELKPVFEELARTHKVPEGFRFPEKLTLEYSADYHIVEVESTEGKKFTAAYMGEYGENGQPFMILTLFEDEAGKKCVSFAVEFVKMYVTGRAN